MLFSPELESVNPPELRLPSFAQTHRQNIVDHLTQKSKKLDARKFSPLAEKRFDREKKSIASSHFFVVVGWDGT